MRMGSALVLIALVAAVGLSLKYSGGHHVVAVESVDTPRHGGEQVEIPLRVKGGRLVVPVKSSNGNELTFALTTGYPITVLSQSGAARVGHGSELSLGGLPVPTDGSETIPDLNLTADGEVLDGMIGSNMLNQFEVLIDVPGGRLLLGQVGRPVSWDGIALSAPVNLRVYHGVVIGLDVEFAGKEYMAALDLGLPTLVVNERVKTETNIDAEDVATLRIGNTTLTNVPVRAQELEIFHRWAPNGEGFVMVGAPIAFECAISISWVKQEMRTCVR